MNLENFTAKSITQVIWNCPFQAEREGRLLSHCAMHSGASLEARHELQPARQVFSVCRMVRKYRRQMVLSIETIGTPVLLANIDGFSRLSVHPFLTVAE